MQRTYNRALGMRAFGPDILTGEAQKIGEADPPELHQNSIEKALLKLMKQGEEEPQQQTSEKLQQTEVPFYGHSAKLLEELKRYQQRMQEEGNKKTRRS